MSWSARRKKLFGFVIQLVSHSYDFTHDSRCVHTIRSLGQHKVLILGGFPVRLWDPGGGLSGRLPP